MQERSDRWLAIAVVGLAVALALALAITRAPPTDRGIDRGAAAFMLELINDERAAHGLPALTAARDVAEIAERWSIAMADVRSLDHNPHYGEQFCCWEVAAENVAWSEPHRIWRPGDPVERITEELHVALLDSPGHRVNLLDPQVDQIGIGIYVDPGGSVWITQNFRRYRSG